MRKKKEPSLPAEPIGVDIVIVYTDDNEAIYVNGIKLTEGENEKEPMSASLFLPALVGHFIKSVEWKELQNFDNEEYFPKKLEDALRAPREEEAG